MKSLVIVESPTKAKTISNFLGESFAIRSSYGHIRDLPKSKLGVDVEKNFEPHYIIPQKARANLKELKAEVAKAGEIILATDEDREGEAIAWHLIQALGLENSKLKTQDSKPKQGKVKTDTKEHEVKRIVFHEITKEAIDNAIKNPRPLDMHLVDAQQARRVMDRLVGYKLSPFLWKKITGGLSAGRVQSVALRLIVGRENEIRAFKAEEYWTIVAVFKRSGGSTGLTAGDTNTIEADLYKIDGKEIQKLEIKNEAGAKKIEDDIRGADAKILSVERKETRRNPSPPFITSTLQQEAAKRLGFSSKKTMVLAQKLYESGRITYMRTDSVNLSTESLSAAKNWLDTNLGAQYSEGAPRVFKKKSRLAQEAHEAIRPTSPALHPKSLGGVAEFADKGEEKLYDLIWRRFMASQMPQAVFSTARAEIGLRGKSGSEYIFSLNGSTLKFDGYLKIWPTKFEEKELPELKEGEGLTISEMKSAQHFPDPPPRYNEASLIKALEKYGIGRPSTYAPTISVIQTRNYVEKIERRFHPTEIGEIVNKTLSEHFPQIVDIDFTAKMEEELDEIAEGRQDWRKVLTDFYGPFSKNLEEKYETVDKEKFEEKTDEVCEKCGKPMIVKRGRFGKFLACSGFPECKNTKKLKSEQKLIGMKCPKCGEGDVVERRVSNGRARGKIFWGCSRYPACDYASWTHPLKGTETPEAGEEVKEEAET